MGILAELYEWHIRDEMQRGCCPDKSEAEKHFNMLWKEAEKQLNREFSEELWDSIFAYMNDECCTDFQAGFRMGVLLMLEVRRSATVGRR